MTEVQEVYEDPILRLVRDPNLNRDKEKHNSVIRLIGGFPIAERKVSRLCQSTFSILQTLEKTNLIFRSWEFLSLDFNSDGHFEMEDLKMKDFNVGIAEKVMATCRELNKKVNKISNDIDYITKAARTLSAADYISDSGTLLASLVLRNIKLKNEVVDKLTVSYLKATLMVIGKELEDMLDQGSEDTTVISYKSFIVNLLKQLNQAIDDEDNESKYECLALINDMEKMFETFKLERIKDLVIQGGSYDTDGNSSKSDEYTTLKEPHHLQPSQKHQTLLSQGSSRGTPRNFASDEDYDEYGDFDGVSFYTPTNTPLVHSITKAGDDHSLIHRRDSFSSQSTSGLFPKSISDELPYLMTAFNSAKNFEEDVSHYQEQEKEESETNDNETKKETSPPATDALDKKEAVSNSAKHFLGHSNHLPNISLYSNATILPQVSNRHPTVSASSYVLGNSTLLSKLGIKPQVITADLPPSHSTRSAHSYNKPQHTRLYIESSDPDKDDNEGNKENNDDSQFTPLTKANLASHTILKLGNVDPIPFNDVE